MSDQGDRPLLTGVEAQGDDALESLLRLAGPRTPVPQDRMRRLRAAAHAEWRGQIRVRRFRLGAGWSLGALAAAATIALALRAPRSDPGPRAGSTFATLAALGAGAQVTSANGQAVATLQVGDRVFGGCDTSTNGRGTATLRLPGGDLLRMDRDTTLRLEAADAVVLHKGAVFVDARGDASLEVRTRMGVVRDVGTQFEVRLSSSRLRVRVKDGAVQVRLGTHLHRARPGDELTLEASGAASWRKISSEDAEWAWTRGSGSQFVLEGRSLRDFLDWIAEDNGWRLRFADAGVEEKARTTTLHGSIEGLTPEQALNVVLPASGVEHELEQRVLSIRLAPGASG